MGDPPDHGHRPVHGDGTRPPLIFEIIRDIHQQGTTVLLVEQNARKALALAGSAFVLEQGCIVLSGTGAELLNNEAVVRVYVGSVKA